MKPKQKSIRCEGWRRYGGAFTFGPITWKQCTNQGIVELKFVQDGETKTLPSCKQCWDECLRSGIAVIKAKPIRKGITKTKTK
jgi:hypothetical protein